MDSLYVTSLRENKQNNVLWISAVELLVSLLLDRMWSHWLRYIKWPLMSSCDWLFCLTCILVEEGDAPETSTTFSEGQIPPPQKKEHLHTFHSAVSFNADAVISHFIFSVGTKMLCRVHFAKWIQQ